jgi:N-methylhydantoinase A
MNPKYRLGIDIGGTFTDATLVDEVTGEVHTGKVLTTPQDHSRGFMEAVRRLLSESQAPPEEVRFVVHGTTVATNAIIEGQVAATGFVTTEGFRDLLEIARQVRPSLYDLHFEKPRPLVPRHRCFGVRERLDAHGKVVRSLDEAAVHQVAERLRAEGVEAVAVCLLHSYVNPGHEKRIREILRDHLPEVGISISAEVAPEFREYLRASTTVINACIQPIVARYLLRIEARLREANLPKSLLVMQSSGGVATAEATREKPVFMVESGPAAGVMAAAHWCNTLGHANVIAFDMGGTTAKAGLIRNGSPRITKDYEVGHTAQAATGTFRASGYPIRAPVIDLVEIGAGGGSIAWVDSGGRLRVGPRSAGADPGPVCYGRGGTEPTVTDANLILGRLNPAYFLGGEIELDMAGARRVVQEKCAGPLGLDVVQAAHAIVEIANAAMVNALRLVTVQRGHDPRDFLLIAFGGAGPLHANRLAAETEIAATLVPPSPGTFSALGLLVTDLKHDYSTPLMQRMDRLEVAALDAAYRMLQAEGRSALAHEGVRPEDMHFIGQLELRYVGQSYELPVPIPSADLGPETLAAAVEAFHQEHQRAYGYRAPGEPVECVNLRLTAVGTIAKPRMRRLAESGPDPSSARKPNRQVYFMESGGYVECPIYDRYRLGCGQIIEGPAIIEEADSTTVLHPGYRARIDRFANLLLEASPTAGR